MLFYCIPIQSVVLPYHSLGALLLPSYFLLPVLLCCPIALASVLGQQHWKQSQGMSVWYMYMILSLNVYSAVKVPLFYNCSETSYFSNVYDFMHVFEGFVQ